MKPGCPHIQHRNVKYMSVFHCGKSGNILPRTAETCHHIYRELPRWSPKRRFAAEGGKNKSANSKNKSANIDNSGTGLSSARRHEDTKIFLIVIRVIAKFDGSENPDFKSMDVFLFYETADFKQ
jgi:hypothetical protein